MTLKVYLSGEIHSEWREEIKNKTISEGLKVEFYQPILDHSLSDDCGALLLGEEEKKFWHDHKGAKLNSIRIKKGIQDADIIVVRFGNQYKQWNAAFDAGYAAALGKAIIIIHSEEHQHALKEVDAAAMAVVDSHDKVIKILKYVLNGEI